MSSTDDLFDALERVASIKGKGAQSAKLSILRGLADHREWLRLAIEPTLSFYVAELPKYERHGNASADVEELELLRKLAARELTGDAALEQIRFHMYELSPKSQQLLRRVLLKDLRCGVGATLLNEAFPGLVRVFPYQRCCLPKDSNERQPGWWEAGVVMQLKADGMFVNVDQSDDYALTIFSRQGTPFPPGALGDVEQTLRAALRPGTQTHGELTVYEDGKLLERQVGNGLLNSIAQGGSLAPNQVVRFDAWDQIPLASAVPKGRCEVPYSRRLQQLADQIQPLGPDNEYVRVIESEIVSSRAAGMAFYQRMLARRLEGAVAKRADAIWRDGDNKDQVKLKNEEVVDLKIAGFRPGAPGTRTEATFGAVVCRTADDLLEVGVHGFKREMEQWLHEHRDEAIGMVMAVKANGVMAPTGEAKVFSLFLPRFVELRRDKTEADTLDRVRAQFDQAMEVGA